MLKSTLLALVLTTLTTSAIGACPDQDVKLQVLGSGGPELNDGRASSSYLIWIGDKARVLVDTGGGSSANFEKSGARIEDLQAVLFSHFHADHSGDFPAYVKASFFSPRTEDLPVFGPDGNERMPSTGEFLQALVGSRGAFRYLSTYLDSQSDSAFKLVPHTVALGTDKATYFTINQQLRVGAVPVHHGPIAALAWRVDIGTCSVSFSGDMNNSSGNLAKLATGSQLLVAHNAIPEGTTGTARKLHMPPSEIGRAASEAQVRRLLISHRMNRTAGASGEAATRREIARAYSGPVQFANDMDTVDID